MIELRRIDVETNRQQLENLLKQHQKISQRELYQTHTICSLALYQEEVYVGGIIGKQVDEVLHIELLAVEPTRKHQGFGKQLLEAMIDYGQTQKCTTITLTTLDFQAKDFYIRQGFQVFGCLEDVPVKGTTRYYMVYRY